MALLNKGKNYIINGAMDFWQRGTSFAAATSGTYAADRFLYMKGVTAAHTISRDTDVPTLSQAGYVLPFSYKLTLTTAQASLSAGQYSGFCQRIEGQVFSTLAGRTMTLSFWVKAALAGTYSVAFSNGTQTRSYVKTYTINAANTWEKKTVTLTHDTTGTWDYTTGTGLQIYFLIASTVQSLTESAWVDGNAFGFGTQTNGVQASATSFNFTGIMLEEGEQASQFERAGGDISRELLSCQRYYCKSYILGTAPGTNTGNGTTAGRFIGALAVSASLCGAASFPTNMRISPTVSIFATDGVAGSWSLNTTRPTGGIGGINESGFSVYGGSSVSTGNGYWTHWVADAEL
jgi:hypothetical protein